jgi:hypothetical protein
MAQVKQMDITFSTGSSNQGFGFQVVRGLEQKIGIKRLVP